MTSQTVPLGTYALSESTVVDYTAAAWACTAGTVAGNNVTLSPGNVANCTITNTFVPNPKLVLLKTAAAPTTNFGTSTTVTDAGDNITYTYKVDNTGNLPITTVTPVDTGPKFNGVAGTGTLSAFTPVSGTIAVGGTLTFTATYTLTQADIDNGAGIANGVTNSATATGKDPGGATITSPTSAATTTISNAPSLTTTKSAAAPSVLLGAVATATDGGDTITYSYLVKNTGNVTLTNATPSDAGPSFDGTAGTGVLGSYTPPSATLAPGASASFTAIYTLTQGDVNKAAGISNGTTNSATASATDPANNTVTSPVSNATTTINKTSNLQTTKSAGTPTTSLGAVTATTDGGDTITYTYAVRNPGNVSLFSVVPTDAGPKFNGITGTNSLGAFTPASATILPGDTQNFTASYVLSQTDVNNSAGLMNAVTNSASASGLQPNGSTTTSSSSTASTTINKTASLATAKSAATPTISSGNVSTLTDGNDTIAYSYVVTNTGNVTLTNVAPTDPGPTFNGAAGTGTLGAFSPLSTSLAPGASTTFTATYTLTQGDVNKAAGIANGVSNTATSSGKDPAGTTVTSTASTAKQTINQTKSLTTVKSAASPTILSGAVPTATDAGDSITYSYVVTNSGNVSMFVVGVNDAGPKFNGIAGTNTLGAMSPASATILPGSSQTFTSIYPLSQTDVNNSAGLVNGVSNTATATGTAPDSSTTTSPGSNATTTINSSASLSVVKSVASPTVANGVSTTATDALDTVTYTYVVTNPGNVTMSNVVPVDAGPEFNGLAGSNSLGAFAPPSATLAPGGSQTFTATYVLSQSDVNNAAGVSNGVTNSATATGMNPDGSTTNSGPSTASTTINKSSSLTSAKSAGAPTVANGTLTSVTDASDTITYTYTTRNTGNVTLTGVVPSDPGPTFNGAAGTGTLSSYNPTSATMAPGATQIFTATYTLSQADVNASAGLSNAVSNTATFSGTQPGGATTTSPTATAKTSIAGGPNLVVNKTASLPTVSTLPATITYTITASNTGNVALTGVNLTDVITQGGALTLTSGPTLASGDVNSNAEIDPSETWIYSATYSVTQANMDNGDTIANTATISTAQTAPQSSTVNTTLAKSPSLSMDKTVLSVTTANGANVIATDGLDVITYNYLVTNTGNQTLTNVAPQDAGPKFNSIAGANTLSLFSPAPVTLAPGASQLFSATYILGQSDVNNAAGITNGAANTATAKGTTPDLIAITSPSDIAATTIVNSSTMTLVKSAVVNLGGNGRADAGETVAYAFTITNTGNTTLTNIMVTDALAGVTVSGGPITLAPGASNATSIVGIYTLTQADIDVGLIDNTATTNGKDPRNTTVSAADTLSTPLTSVPSMSIDKTSSTSSYDSTTNTLSYSYLVTNTGNVTLTDPITVADDKVDGAGGSVSCALWPVSGLAPTLTYACSATYNVVQADVDAGAVTNTASAQSAATNSPNDSVTIPAVKQPKMSLLKKARTPIDFNLPGDTVTYDYVVTNTGNTTITSPVTITDNFIPSISCPVWPETGLAPTDTYTCNAIYTVTQDDLDIGSVTNIASATDGTTTSPPTSETIPANAQPALQITKTPATGSSFTAVGNVISYDFVITNSGNVTLTAGIDIVDDKIGTFRCFTGNLPALSSPPNPNPAATQTCSKTYTVTQADLDAGFVKNNAYGKTTYGVGIPPTPVTSPPQSATVNAAQSPALLLTKSVATLPVLAAGQILTYTFEVKNTGNQTLGNITVTDPLIPSLSCTVTTLNVSATDSSCQGIYSVTQSNVDAGTLSNTANASGINPLGAVVSDVDTLITAMPAPDPKMTLTKSPSLTSFSEPGQSIGYTFTIANIGNVTLSNIVVTDPLVSSFTCTIPTLAPGNSDTTCSTSYVTTQQDVDDGSVPNTASATGKDPFNTTVNATGSKTVPAIQSPAISLVKTGTLNPGGDGRADVNDTITYNFTIKNEGNMSLSNIVVTDPRLATLSCTVPSLAVGGIDTTCSAIYTLTQADMNAGEVLNTAALTSKDPQNNSVDTTANATTTLPAAPSIAVVKTAGAPTIAAGLDATATDAGDTIAYAFTVTNAGNVSLTSVSVMDTKVASVACAPTTLDPGDVSNCSGTYTLTLSDMNAGSVTNQATASGTPPTGPVVTDFSDEATPGSGTGKDDPTLTPLTQTPKIQLTKTGTLNDGGDGRADVGDTINYTFVVKNTGTVTLSNVTLSDPLVTVNGGPILALIPGGVDALTFDATYTLTQTDIDTGSRANTATVRANPPTGPPQSIQDDDSANVLLTGAPSIAIVKTATAPTTSLGANTSITDVNDTITYSFVVNNTGNVTLNPVSVSDPLLATITCAATSLAPGLATNCTAADYAITLADMNMGKVENQATANGKPPTGPNVSDLSDEATPGPGAGNDDKTVSPLASVAAIAVVKTAATPTTALGSNVSVTDANDTVSYSFVVTNTGNVTLTPVSVSDPLLGAVTCLATSLDPGSATSCSAPAYVITLADLNAGKIDNQATATGKPPTGANVSDVSDETTAGSGTGKDDPTSTPLLAVPSVAVVKTAATPTTALGASSSVTDAGDTVAYTFAVTNTGNITLDPVSVTDIKVPGIVCSATSLAPGAATSCASPTPYTISLADMDAGKVDNQATVSGTPPSGAPVTDLSDEATPGTGAGKDDPTSTPLASVPSIALVKTASPPTVALGADATIIDAGDTIAYHFITTNTGNVTLDPVSVSDPMVPGIVCAATTLAPGSSTNCSGPTPYTITLADMNAGKVDNQATATGKPPTSVAVTDLSDEATAGAGAGNDDPTSTPLAAAPSITLIKTGAAPTIALGASVAVTDEGDTIDYVFIVTNTGNVTLSPVSVTDTKLSGIMCAATSLAPGMSTSCASPAPYTITLADIDAGQIANQATAIGKPPTGADVTDLSDEATPGTGVNNDDPTITPLTAAPSITVVKTAGALTIASGAIATITDAGDTIAYSFAVTNTGNVTLNSVSVTDTKVSGVVCVTTSLAPGASTNCASATPYTITLADMNAGKVDNQATVSGAPPAGAPVTDLSDEATPGSGVGKDDPTSTPLASSPSITLVKIAGAPTVALGASATFTDAGDTVTYSFVIKNTGNVSLDPIAISDPKLNGFSCVATNLAPGLSTNCSAIPYTITVTDMNAGSISNQATATGTSPTGSAVTDISDEATPGMGAGNDDPTITPLGSSPAIAIVKTAGAPTTTAGTSAIVTDVGDTIVYAFTVNNTGNVTLNPVVVSDPKISGIVCADTSLSPGASTTCSHPTPYVITLNDMNAGKVSNQATVSGTPPTGPIVTDLSDESTPGAGVGNDDPTDTPLAAVPAITVIKAAGTPTTALGAGTTQTDVGDTISYTFNVTNTGNVTLNPVSVTDAKVSGIVCPAASLAPGASISCNSPTPYTITLADMNAGKVDNQATASGTPPTGPAVTDLSDESAPGTGVGNDDPTSTPLASAPFIAIVKTVGIPTTALGASTTVTDADDTIVYAFNVTNTGNVTLDPVSVTDPIIPGIVCAATSLAPGVSMNCAGPAPYTITLADMNSGRIDNQAAASGTPPTGADVTDLSDEATPGAGTGKDDPTSTPLAPSPSIAVVKTAGTPTIALGTSATITDAGDTIAYGFVVSNTGNVTLNPVSVADPMLGTITCVTTSLAPGIATNCSAPNYVITLADLNAGKIDNQATASGIPPTGAAVTDQSDEATPGVGPGKDDPTSTPLAASPSIAVVKTAGTPTLALGANATITDAGDTIAYTFAISNAGSVTLNAVSVTDAKIPGIVCASTTLVPGAVTSCTSPTPYTISLADLNLGKVDNQATASGTPPTGPAVTDLSDETTPGAGSGNDDPTSTPLASSPSIALVKTAAAPTTALGVSTTITDAGDTITYAFAVTNTGNVTLNSVTVTDPLISGIVCAQTSLSPGASTSCASSTPYTITLANMNAGKIDNQATASGTPPTGQAVTDLSDEATPGAGPGKDDSTSTPLAPKPSIGLAKTSLFNDENADTYAQVNETITYSFIIKNTGNVNLTAIAVGDAIANPVTCLANSLLPNATTTCSATLTLTLVQIQSGQVSNTATVSGTPPTGPAVQDVSDSTNPSDGPTPGSFASGAGQDDPTLTPLLTKPIIAVNDSASGIDGLAGNPSIYNVLGNDLLGSAPGTTAVVSLAVDPATPVPTVLTFNPATGVVGVKPGTPPGTYSFTYNICELTNPLNCASAVAEVTVIGAAVSGTVFLDQNGNGTLDASDPPAGAGYIVELVNNSGNTVGTDTTAPDGSYNIFASPGPGYTLVFKTPAGGVLGTITNLTIGAGTTVVNQNQPIDPAGVIYDSVTHVPVSGVTAALTDAAGNPLPAACLLPGQQNQVTNASGSYRFDIVPGGAAQCPLGATSYLIRIVNPSGYASGFSAVIPPQAGSVSVGTCPIDAVPGGSCDVSASPNPPPVGTGGVYFTAFVIGNGDPDLVNNHIAIDPLPGTFSKVANVSTAKRGETIIYTISADGVAFNPSTITDTLPNGLTFIDGSATSNGAAVVPAVAGNTLTFIGLTPNAAQKIKLVLKVVVNASALPGNLVNRTQLINPATGDVIGNAKASIELLPEHTFDCSDIIGKVFEDKNRDGYQDKDEPGLPGVRLATVKGQLITTDSNGRYHVGCADLPDQEIGSNFILKLDTRTLPTGYRVTTENPKTVRLTAGKLTKLNFGASISRVIRFDLNDELFNGSDGVMPRKLQAIVGKLVVILDQAPSVLRLTYYQGGDGHEAAQKRLAAVKSLINKTWHKRLGRYELPVEAQIVGVK